MKSIADRYRTKLSKWTIAESILFLLIMIQLGTIFYVNIAHYNYKLNADIASEGLLARLIWESGEWIPSTWYVAEETRVFDVANLAALFYGMTGSMQLAVGLACCVMTLGIVLSGYYFVSKLRLTFLQKELFLLLCLSLPNNFMIIELFYLFASYYSPHIIVLFITLGIYAKTLEEKPRFMALGIALLLHFMLGVQGVRGILVIAGPIFAVELLRMIYQLYKKSGYTRDDLCVLVWSFLLMAAAFLYHGKKQVKIIVLLLGVAIFLSNYAKVYQPILESKDLVEDPRYEVVQFLEEKGYKRAYSSFEQSNTMTSMCNGRVQVSPVASYEKMDICKWMASTDWYGPNVPFEERTAYIVSEYFLDEFGEFLEKHPDTIVFETKIGQFYIYGSEYNYSTLE